MSMYWAKYVDVFLPILVREGKRIKVKKKSGHSSRAPQHGVDTHVIQTQELES